MDAVEIFLLWAVGLATLVYFIVDILDSVDESRKFGNDADQSSEIYDSVSITETWFGVSEKASDEQEDKISVRGDLRTEEPVVSENIEREVFEEINDEETENPANASSEGSSFRGAVPDFGRDIRIREDDVEIFDDWEGVERTGLEKIFGEALVFMNQKGSADKIDGDVKLQLYGLQKVALQGPCYASQPMALKVSARAKWNSWQKLGNMSREMAMEQYVNLLSKAIPGWKSESTSSRDINEARIADDQSQLM